MKLLEIAITKTVAEVGFIQVSFVNVASKENKKIKMNRQKIMSYPYYSKVRSTQDMGVPLFFCVVHGT